VDDIVAQLKEAKADRHESSRARKLNDAVESLKRLVPGVHGKLIELCKPVQHKVRTPLQQLDLDCTKKDVITRS
jgi:structural maintenance of chromosome 1